VSRRFLRRRLPALLIVLVAGLVLGVLSASSSSSVTRARLERSLPRTFSNLYVQQARILGHKGVTVQSLHARAQCDKGGSKVPDHGPGADWICLMTWHDPNIDETLMPGKFEMNVHSNDCYTAGGPSKLVGLLTITDTHGNDVSNPVFEFDGCFDPRGSNHPTGVTIQTNKTSTSATPTAAALTLPHGTAQVDGRRASATLACSAGDGGCAGSVSASLDGAALGSRAFVLAPGKSGAVRFLLTPPQRRRGGTLVLTVRPVIGTAATTHTTLTLPPG